jgi:hypothetical protein
MQKKRAIFLLRLAFILGVITDAAAVLPMLSTKSAGNFWGFEAFPDPTTFFMHFGAALMIGWALLLIWASFKPLEHRMIAAMTVVVVAVMIVAEIIAIQGGVLTFGRALVSLIIQALIFVLYSFAFVVSRKSNLLPGKHDSEKPKPEKPAKEQSESSES